MSKAEQILKKHLAGGHMAFAVRQMVLAAMEEYAAINLQPCECKAPLKYVGKLLKCDKCETIFKA